MGAGLVFLFVFLRRVAPFQHLRLAKQRVVFDIDFRVQRDHIAIGGHDQRVDFDHRSVAFDEQPVQLHRNPGELGNLALVESHRESHLAGLVRLQAGRRVHRQRVNFFRLPRRDFLDIHAARRGRHKTDALAGAVHDQAQIKFARNFGTHLDDHRVNRQAFGSGLPGDQRAPQHVERGFFDFIDAGDQPDASCLATTTRVHLRLDHPDLTAQLPGSAGCVIGRVRRQPFWYGNVVLSKQSFRLVFVEIHLAADPGFQKARIVEQIPCLCKAVWAWRPLLLQWARQNASHGMRHPCRQAPASAK